MAVDGLQIDSGALGPCQVLRATANEAMNGLSRWTLEVTAERGDLDLDAAAGSPASLLFLDELEGTSRQIDLVIVEIAYEGEERVGHRYTLALASPLWSLTLRSGFRVFVDKSVQEIVPQVLRDAGVSPDRIVLRLGGDYTARPQCTQYDETDWAFVERLLAEEGISYWFDHEEGKGGVIVLGDKPGSHDGIASPVMLPFADPTGMVRVRTLSSLEVSEEVTTTAVTVRDFDVRNPGVYFEGKVGEGPLSHFEFPAFVASSAAAKARAQVRLEQLQAFRVRASGVTDCIRVQPGRVFAVEGAADDEMDRRYLVVAQRIMYHRPASHNAAGQPFRCEVTLVPVGDAPFRPGVPAQRPRIEGIESAITTGPAGEEIHVDDLGRVKLRFHWDSSSVQDDRSSAWARCLQWSLTGSMFLPRVGWEVPVAYLDGCPDRPFVLQRFYNATTVTPYPLPGAAATTSIKSATSPGAGNVNEIMMSDVAGSQQMFVHASRDQTVAVGGSATTDVSADATHDVGLMLARVVTGSQSSVIGAFQSVDVGTDWATTVGGSTTFIVAGLQRQHVKANRGVTASGAYAEVIGGAYLLTCNQSNMKVTGGFLQVNAAGTALRSGIGVAEVVAGARYEHVGGPYTIIASEGFSDTTIGFKRISAGGASSETAGGDVVTTAPLGKVEAATASITASGAISILGASVTIEAGSLIAGALEISGGAFQVTSGSFVINGASVDIPSGAKFE